MQWHEIHKIQNAFPSIFFQSHFFKLWYTFLCAKENRVLHNLVMLHFCGTVFSHYCVPMEHFNLSKVKPASLFPSVPEADVLCTVTCSHSWETIHFLIALLLREANKASFLNFTPLFLKTEQRQKYPEFQHHLLR